MGRWESGNLGSIPGCISNSLFGLGPWFAHLYVRGFSDKICKVACSSIDTSYISPSPFLF